MNSNNSYNQTPLFYAAVNGHITMVELLIKKGADVDMDSKDSDNRTLLSYAVLGKNIAVIELLIKKGADLEYTDEDGIQRSLLGEIDELRNGSRSSESD